MTITVSRGVSITKGVVIATPIPPGITGLTMNSADAGPDITLTNGDLTYENTASSGAYQAVRATSLSMPNPTAYIDPRTACAVA